jgi:hypothetical protein
VSEETPESIAIAHITLQRYFAARDQGAIRVEGVIASALRWVALVRTGDLWRIEADVTDPLRRPVHLDQDCVAVADVHDHGTLRVRRHGTRLR